MAEFETIISRGSPVKLGCDSRPLSRLRNIPSPALGSPIGLPNLNVLGGLLEGEDEERDALWRGTQERRRATEENWRTRRNSEVRFLAVGSVESGG